MRLSYVLLFLCCVTCAIRSYAGPGCSKPIHPHDPQRVSAESEHHVYAGSFSDGAPTPAGTRRPSGIPEVVGMDGGEFDDYMGVTPGTPTPPSRLEFETATPPRTPTPRTPHQLRENLLRTRSFPGAPLPIDTSMSPCDFSRATSVSEGMRIERAPSWRSRSQSAPHGTPDAERANSSGPVTASTRRFASPVKFIKSLVLPGAVNGSVDGSESASHRLSLDNEVVLAAPCPSARTAASSRGVEVQDDPEIRALLGPSSHARQRYEQWCKDNDMNGPTIMGACVQNLLRRSPLLLVPPSTPR